MKNYSGILDNLNDPEEHMKINEFFISDDDKSISFDFAIVHKGKEKSHCSSEAALDSNRKYTALNVQHNHGATESQESIKFALSFDRKERLAVFGIRHNDKGKHYFLGVLDGSFRARSEDIHESLGHNPRVVQLMGLIEAGNYGKFSEIIADDPSIIKEPLSPEDGQEGLLVKAISCGSFDCAKILIENGADVNLILDGLFYSGNNLLGYALIRGEFDIARLLLRNGAKTGVGDYEAELAFYNPDQGPLTKAGYEKLIENLRCGIDPVNKFKAK